MPTTTDAIGLALCGNCSRYGPYDDEELKTDLETYKPSFIPKYLDKLGRRFDLANKQNFFPINSSAAHHGAHTTHFLFSSPHFYLRHGTA